MASLSTSKIVGAFSAINNIKDDKKIPAMLKKCCSCFRRF